MIAKLRGSVEHKTDKHIVLMVGDVGYRVYIQNDILHNTNKGERKDLWIHHVIREDASDLYGFETEDALDFFELLIGISGIGPKTALGILNVSSIGILKKAINTGDTGHLTRISGIGQKNAQKIVLELKGKIKEDMTNTSYDLDVFEALQALGFNQNQIRTTLSHIEDNLSTEEKIKQALKELSK